MNYIPRAIQRYVEHASKTIKCVLLTGARQTGKSTMLRRLFPSYKCVPLDDPFVEDQTRENPDMFFMLNPPPVFLDEVQRTPSLFRYLKMKCDESDERGRFLLSSSQPLELMESASESLSGRVCVVELSGLSLRKISGDKFNEPFVPTLDYIARRNQTAKAPENIWEVIHRGGYPELQNQNVEWAAFFSSYVKTYLERDVRKLSAVQDLDDFRRFMVAVAARTGQMDKFFHALGGLMAHLLRHMAVYIQRKVEGVNFKPQTTRYDLDGWPAVRLDKRQPPREDFF